MRWALLQRWQSMSGRRALLLLLMTFLCVVPGSASAGSLPELLSTPHSGWLWSNPSPQGNWLNAVAFAGSAGVAVGSEGTILRSRDGGSSWSSVPSDTTTDLSLLQVVDPMTVFVGDACRLQKSTDGGASFAPLAFNPSQHECDPVRSFWFLSATSGFVETTAGSILWTSNGGRSFEARTPVPLFGAMAGPVEFLSPTVGLAIVSGENIGRIMRTTDGGRSWAVVDELHRSLSGITFATSLVGYAVGDRDMLLRTEDGGFSWRTMPLALPPGTAVRNLKNITCRNDESCLIETVTERGASSVLIRTVDGGRTATTVKPSSQPGEIVEAVGFAQPGEAVAVGSFGTTAVSHDDGASFTTQLWRGVRFDDFEQPPRVRLGRSPLEAYVTAEHGRVVATSDGGHLWRTLTLPSHEPVVDVAFPNRARGFAVVRGGAVYRTADGGGSWKRCGAEGHAPVSLLAPSTRVVVVGNEHGVWRSTDACANFIHLRGTITLKRRRRPLSSVDLSFGSAYLARGHAMFLYGRQVLESTDDGASWELVPYPPANLGLADISFLSANVGYELLQGRLYFTRDRGRRWREIVSLPSEESAEAPVMSFSSVRDGYVATRYEDEEGGNIVFRTEDAGRTWIPEQLPNHIGGLTATAGLAYAAREGGDEVFVTSKNGLAGGPSRLTLAIAGSAVTSARALARAHERVTVRGTLSPRVADATIHISWLGAFGGWSSETTVTDAQGAFSFSAAEVSSTTWFVANWNGDGANRGAGTRPVRLTVRR